MVKEIVKYPTTPSLEFGGNVRHFDESLFELIRDLKDTIEANNLNALAAFQIGSPYAVIVIKKEDGSYLEIINPRIIKREGTVEPTETTAYFPGLSAKTKRYEKIKLMYEDREGNQKFLEADGDLAITIQRKIDYVFGSNFRVRLSDEERKLFDSKLEFGTDAITDNGCPTVFKRDRILQLFRVLFISAIIGLVGSFFVSEETLVTLKSVESYLMASMLGLIVIYFFYAQYEGRQYKNCSSCQIGNIIGTSAIELTKLLVLFIASYFIL
ncbi:MAG TPA: peptide deformylase [Sulfurimonas autotrophica]|uniref:Peptide deformylase n=1 Tax=Sulfurimonas autotrophica TaxID=202747 RepID=A0A7C3GJ41_9BACT|nr:peptide deformylase [Sulfurimonas autotrophica]